MHLYFVYSKVFHLIIIDAGCNISKIYCSLSCNLRIPQGIVLIFQKDVILQVHTCFAHILKVTVPIFLERCDMAVTHLLICAYFRVIFFVHVTVARGNQVIIFRRLHMPSPGCSNILAHFWQIMQKPSYVICFKYCLVIVHLSVQYTLARMGFASRCAESGSSMLYLQLKLTSHIYLFVNFTMLNFLGLVGYKDKAMYKGQLVPVGSEC